MVDPGRFAMQSRSGKATFLPSPRLAAAQHGIYIGLR